MSDLPIPSFIDRDPAAVVAEMVAKFETDTGKTLYPAQAERLYINQVAYRESLLREAVQSAALQNLVDFAGFPMLDYLGRLVGTYRQAATAATTTLRFTVPVAFAYDVFIPQGVRVTSTNGLLVFATDATIKLPLGDLYVDIPATCETAGLVGNGWEVGQIASVLDDTGLTGLVVINQAVSAGGAEDEGDESLRRRIKLAPESFTTAGSRGAYIYHGLSAHPAITDIAVTSPVAGEVNIYVLTGSDVPSGAVLSAVAERCNGEKVRPLCVFVSVFARTVVSYSLTASITLYNGADQTAVLAAVNEALAVYTAIRASRLGYDVVLSHIIQTIRAIPGVYDLVISSPVASIDVADSEVAVCSAISVSVAGFADG